jgi:hypothetical protein
MKAQEVWNPINDETARAIEFNITLISCSQA